MSTELTAAEEDAITLTIDTEEPTLNVAPLLREVTLIVEAREAAARREALLEAEANANALRSQIDSAECASRCYQRELREEEAKVARVEALAKEWRETVFKIPAGHPMTVQEFCQKWFVEPLTAALAEPERDEEGR